MVLKEKIDILENAKINIKNDLQGIDEIVDGVIDSIKIWWLTPNLLNRPVVINLWGMTGTGKTSLVDSLCKHLNMSDDLLRLNMNSDGSEDFEFKTYGGKLRDKIEDSEEHGRFILHLDEFHTLEDLGKDDRVGRLSYFNNILGTGELPDLYRKKVIVMLKDMKNWYSVKDSFKIKEDCDVVGSFLSFNDIDNNLTYKKLISVTLSYFNNISGESVTFNDILSKLKIKEIFKNIDLDATYVNRIITDEEIEENLNNYSTGIGSDRPFFILAQTNILEVMMPYIDYLLEHENKINSTVKLNNVLFFISGNFDSLFSGAPTMFNLGYRAIDFLHDLSKEINIGDIKQALTTYLRPEFISRLGTKHFIFPSLSVNQYKDVIDSYLNKIYLRFIAETGKELLFTDSLKDGILKNFIIPSQGVRVLINNIDALISNLISGNISNILTSDKNVFTLSTNKSKTLAIIDTDPIFKTSLKLNEVLNKKKKLDKNALISVSVHEAGHAILNNISFGTWPDVLEINEYEQSGTNFFKRNPERVWDKPTIEKEIRTLLAGSLAEKVVFGSHTLGGENDRERATNLLLIMYTKSGMGVRKGTYEINPMKDSWNGYRTINTDDLIEGEIENEIKKLEKETESILKQNKSSLLKLSDALMKRKILSKKQIKGMFPIIKVEDNGKDLYECFLKQL